MKAHMLVLPSQSEIAAAIEQNIEHDVIHKVRECLQNRIAEHFVEDFTKIYTTISKDLDAYRIVGDDIQKRSLKNLALSYLSY